MTQVEHNAILYFADYLSLRDTSCPVTDTCKYFFVHQTPINAAYIAGYEPIYDENSKFISKAKDIYNKIKDSFGDDAVGSFIEDICFLRACGMVDATRMLLHIHLYSSKYERNLAFLQYEQWKKDQIYTHIITNEDGKQIERQCTKYFKHAEEIHRGRKLHDSLE